MTRELSPAEYVKRVDLTRVEQDDAFLQED